MNGRHLLTLAAGVVVSLAAAFAFSRPELPSSVEVLGIGGWRTAYTTLRRARRDKRSPHDMAFVAVDLDERVGMFMIGKPKKIYWNGKTGELLYFNFGKITDLSAFSNRVSEAVVEFEANFQNSTWTEVTSEKDRAYGYTERWHVELPFDWSNGHYLDIELASHSRMLRGLTVRTSDSEMLTLFGIGLTYRTLSDSETDILLDPDLYDRDRWTSMVPYRPARSVPRDLRARLPYHQRIQRLGFEFDWDTSTTTRGMSLSSDLRNDVCDAWEPVRFEFASSRWSNDFPIPPECRMVFDTDLEIQTADAGSGGVCFRGTATLFDDTTVYEKRHIDRCFGGKSPAELETSIRHRFKPGVDLTAVRYTIEGEYRVPCKPGHRFFIRVPKEGRPAAYRECIDKK